jgi:hypothetical protein
MMFTRPDRFETDREARANQDPMSGVRAAPLARADQPKFNKSDFFRGESMM